MPLTGGASRLHGAAWQRVSRALQRQTVGDHPVCAYVYDLDTVLSQAHAVRAALTRRCELYYAVKANSHPAVLSTLAGQVDGFEVASLGEIDKAVAAGAVRLALSGPGKTDAQIASALRAGVGLLNVESMHELRRAAWVGAELGIRVPVAYPGGCGWPGPRPSSAWTSRSYRRRSSCAAPFRQSCCAAFTCMPRRTISTHGRTRVS
jgi:diaminopimelate decarboxylase